MSSEACGPTQPAELWVSLWRTHESLGIRGGFLPPAWGFPKTLLTLIEPVANMHSSKREQRLGGLGAVRAAQAKRSTRVRRGTVQTETRLSQADDLRRVSGSIGVTASHRQSDRSRPLRGAVRKVRRFLTIRRAAW